MKLAVAAVGHKLPGWIADGVNDYARRMPPDWPLQLIDIKPGHRAAGEDGSRARAQEAEKLLAAVPPGGLLVALDERGAQLTTRELAGWLKTWQDEGQAPVFVIGGADGLDATVRARAHKTLALSRLTLPHALARLLLVEQLYRAMCILKGHPYHRD